MTENLKPQTSLKSNDVAEAFMEVLATANNPDGVYDDIREIYFLKKYPHYRFRPVSFRTFVESPTYLDLEGVMYEKMIQVGETITRGNFIEFIFKAGLGTGKSFLISVLMVYMSYLLLCLKDPHGFFNLNADKPITLINMSVREKQAKKVIFASIHSFIKGSKWFRKIKKNVLSVSIELDGKIELICGNSSENAAIGLNLFFGVLDEADFFLDNNDKSSAEDIYDTMDTRRASRFGNKGMTVAISSPLHDESFINKKTKEALENPDTMYCISMPTWHGKDRHKMSEKAFLFDSEKMMIIPPEKYNAYNDGVKTWNLPLTPQKMKTLAFATDDLNDRFWIIPVDFYNSFKKNPEKASRDLGAKSFRSQDTFIKLPSFIDIAFKKDMPNFAQPDKWDIKPDLTDEPLFVHIDMGLNRETSSGQGDACGIAVGHFDGYDNNSEGRPKIKFLAIEKITRSAITGEVNFRDVRARVFALVKAGYMIGKVTFDGWQSADSIQTFNSQGIPCELLSVDTTIEPYESAKEAMYEKRLIAPYIPIVVTEFKHLQVIKAKKIDHPKKGSKDVSDAVAGVVFSILKNYGVDADGVGGGGALSFSRTS